MVLSTILVLGICAQCLLEARYWLHSAPPRTGLPRVPEGPASTAPELAPLVDAHLFGSPEIDTPSSSVTLELHGTIAVGPPDAGFGLIAPQGGTEALYGVGAAVPGGGTVRSVYLDHVVIDRGGAIESLYLPRSALRGLGLVAAASDSGLDREPIDPGMPAGAVRITNGTQINIEDATLATTLHVGPLVVDGHLLGYKLGSLDNGRSPLPGLQPGALLTAINGERLVDGPVATRLFQSLAGSTHATVTVSLGERLQMVEVDTSGVSGLLNATSAQNE
jgi:general secretion pathway protein C